MESSKPLTDDDGEVRELATDDLKFYQSVDSLPPSLASKLGVRGPQKAPTTH